MQTRIIFGVAAALMIGVSASAYAQTTPENCQAMFQKADVNKDGALQQQEAQIFVDAMNKAEVKPQDASAVTQDEFMAACQKDAFANIDPAMIGTQQSTATAEQPAAPAASGEATTDQSATDTTATTTTTDQSATDTTATTTTTDQTASTTTTDTAAPAAPAAEEALAVPDALMASNLIGANLYSNNNENIAEIKDVVLSQEGGQATHVIVDAGDNDVAIELNQLKIAATEDGLKIVLDGSQADLAKFPVVNKQ
jgi:sporulation protein YlmC with PRC-barrel domain